MKIVKSNSFYEKLRDDKFTYKLNMEKVRYMNEILSGFLESCKSIFLIELRHLPSRSQGQREENARPKSIVLRFDRL